MKALKIALAASMLASGGAATAQTASDLQCIVVSNAFAGAAKEDNAQKIAEASVYFYLGRIGNTMTSAQLKTQLEAQAKTLNQQTAPGIMNKCTAAIQAKVVMLQSIAASAKAAAAPAKPAATPKTTPPPGR